MISAGQQRVREIAQEILDVNKNLAEPEKNIALGNLLIERISADGVIRNDHFAGRSVGHWTISKTYTAWLIDREWEKVSAPDLGKGSFDFNKIRFLGSVIGSWNDYSDKPLYLGGSSPGSVAYSILSLQNDKIPLSKGMDIRYYVNSGMSVIYDGNHHMAGYKLSGYTNFPMDKVIVYNDIFDKNLNDSLFILENQFYDLPQYFLHEIKNPSAKRVGSLASFYEDYPDLVDFSKRVGGELTLEKINLIANAYEEMVLNSSKPNWLKIFFQKTTVEPFTADTYYLWLKQNDKQKFRLQLESQV